MVPGDPGSEVGQLTRFAFASSGFREWWLNAVMHERHVVMPDGKRILEEKGFGEDLMHYRGFYQIP